MPCEDAERLKFGNRKKASIKKKKERERNREGEGRWNQNFYFLGVLFISCQNVVFGRKETGKM